MGYQIASATKVVYDLDQMMARDPERLPHLVHCHPRRVTQRDVHEHAERIVGVRAETHAGTLTALDGHVKAKGVFQIYLLQAKLPAMNGPTTEASGHPIKANGTRDTKAPILGAMTLSE